MQICIRTATCRIATTFQIHMPLRMPHQIARQQNCNDLTPILVAQVALQHLSLSSAVVQVAAVQAVLAGESMRTPLSQLAASNVAQPVAVCAAAAARYHAQ